MADDTLCWQGEDLILPVRLQPRARKDALLGWHDGRLKVAVTAPPSDGQANARLLKLLSKAFRTPVSQITLEAGHTSRSKRVRIHAPRQLPPIVHEKLAERPEAPT